MFSDLAKYLVNHRSAILATLVLVQNSHVVKGVGAAVITALVTLLGG